MKFGIVVFPGSNCDHDAYRAIREGLGEEARFLWHKDQSLGDVDCLILPGGFSYGDYLRAGAIARFSPIMGAVTEFARRGGLVLGICNGFQILLEAGLLPGAMLRNRALKFVCRFVSLRVENRNTPFTHLCRPGQILKLPVKHGEGNYFADPDTLRLLQERDLVVLRYCTPSGEITVDANPNGALKNIAGVCNEAGNVFGLMPHPENASAEILGSVDGLFIFRSIVSSLKKRSDGYQVA
ncbi:MAG: phosphoribosylformylglycinamidine synthase subunit PurQ [Candidatus Tectomicrobia bacterium]|uniref:Phosphoribosylformylglycinamidine synthase subunit PurQ n=1 Tax=Tectimicrobiota bacterium TaxID=2528274 RepID=A0A932GR51_UNCTE|nr:phosphoribosylformylglycinamidine synthase subunit PurQ [Candidatus Tectomicrobia bacterium]